MARRLSAAHRRHPLGGIRERYADALGADLATDLRHPARLAPGAAAGGVPAGLRRCRAGPCPPPIPRPSPGPGTPPRGARQQDPPLAGEETADLGRHQRHRLVAEVGVHRQAEHLARGALRARQLGRRGKRRRSAAVERRRVVHGRSRSRDRRDSAGGRRGARSRSSTGGRRLVGSSLRETRSPTPSSRSR